MVSKGVKGYVWDQAECLPRPDLERLQVERLRACLDRLAQTVPFYRDKLAQTGISPASIRTVGDISQLPFTVKDDLREHYPFGLFGVPMSEIVRLHASSGTTGKPIVVGYTLKDIELWSDLIARALAAAGATRDDIVQNAYGYGLFTGGLGLHYGVERLGAKVVPISGGNTGRQVMLMRDFGSTVLCCTPSYALVIAEGLAQQGVDVTSLPLRVGIFGAEPWTEEMRREIESRLGIVALDIYGLSEIMGPGVAMECTHKQGLHIYEDHFIPEVVDPDTGEPLPDGEVGELVFSSITKQALPLLRYRTRDRTRLFRDPCVCGRTTVRMEKIQGRTDDMLIIRGVNVFPSQIEAALLRAGETEPQYQIVVDRGARRTDELTVLVEAADSTVNDRQRNGQLQNELSSELHSALGISCKVELVRPFAIERTEGKAVRVVDKR